MPTQANQPAQSPSGPDSNRARKLLFRLSKPPYGRSQAREALDALLAAAAFEQDVSVLFVGDGLYLLLKNQQPGAIEQKNFTASFGLFNLYGINQIYAAETDLVERRLTPDQLALAVTVLSREELTSLLRSQDQILSF